MLSTFFNFSTTKLTLNKSISPIIKMEHQVGFQTVAVTIVR